MAQALLNRGYKVISEGTDNHMLLIDLRNKGITGKDAEKALELADITANKNMVPFDDKSPFITSGIRLGTPAVTTRGLLEDDMQTVVAFIDQVVNEPENEEGLKRIKKDINEMMSDRPLFQYQEQGVIPID